MFSVEARLIMIKRKAVCHLSFEYNGPFLNDIILQEIGQLTHLERLSLSSDVLTDEGIRQLQNMSNLKEQYKNNDVKCK